MEVEELVRINRNTFRPRRRRVQGREEILQHLTVNQGSLVAPTRQLLDANTGKQVRFEIRGPGWVPAPRTELVKEEVSEERLREFDTVASQVGTLAKRVRELEALLETMTQKLAALEARVASGATVASASAEPAGAQEPGLADTQTVETAPVGEPATDDVQAVAASEAAPAPDFPPLQVPSSDAILDLVRGLAGDNVRMSKVAPGSFTLDTASAGYLACLKSDGGEVLGALIMDTEATIRLAGGMLMEDVEELDAQVEDGTPSDDVLDAAGEVLNTLTSAVNKTSGNAHVRAGALETLESSEQAWLTSARAREDFNFSVGGRLVVVCR